MLNQSLPKMLPVRQLFPESAPLDIESVVRDELAVLQPHLRPGMRVAVGVGSRGISNLRQIVASVLDWLRSSQVDPFIVPAMGSHGGATAEGQTQLLAEYGVTADELHVPIRAAMDAECLGRSEDGVPVYCSREALAADGIILINRIKPHTDFGGALGSGLSKMLVVGLGKRDGAASFHAAASRLGYEHVLRSLVPLSLSRTPLLGGVAILEDQRHHTARIQVLPREQLQPGEAALFPQARQLMPHLPFDDIDLLIIDRMGKNVSGTGLDPNIIGRDVHGYSAALNDRSRHPTIRRLFVRELTAESHGNAVGIGMADFTSARLVRSIDRQVTAINALTALTVQLAKVPIHFETDRETIGHALCSLVLDEPARARVVRIADTLSLEYLEVSQACLETAGPRPNLECLGEPAEMGFDAEGNLQPMHHRLSSR